MRNCKHYELDTKEKEICDELWEDYWNSLTPEQKKAEKEHAEKLKANSKPSPIPKKCQDFCKHLDGNETKPCCKKTGKTFGTKAVE